MVHDHKNVNRNTYWLIYW
uniref:Uncharacterized protein n=1 Tax=Anguilla anguilla TaxID=7936 RepID=A0A0E9TMF0_ANGAN